VHGRPEPRFTEAVRKLYPTVEQLTDAADAARALVEQPGWDVLVEILQAEIATIDRRLGSDRPLDTHGDYAMAHGRRSGLLAPGQAIHALIDRAESRLADERAKYEGAAESVPDGRS
jgi:hypothetical protein